MATAHGRKADPLPASSWYVIRGTPDPLSPARQDRLTHLFGTYWKPIYRYVRASWGKSIEECREVVQAYVSAALETDLILPYGLQNGGFRRFVKQSLVTFLVDRRASVGRRPMKPESEAIAFDPAEAEGPGSDPGPGSPEEVFDRQWARELVARSLERMHRELRDDGNEVIFRIWEHFEIHPTSPRPPSPEAAARVLGLPEEEMLGHLDTARSLLDELLVELICDTVATRTEAQQELRELFGT